MIFQVQPESQLGATACVVLAKMVGKRLGCLGEECEEDLSVPVSILLIRRTNLDCSAPLQRDQE